MILRGPALIIGLFVVGIVHAQPAMPPLCTVRAEVVDRDQTDSTLQLRILELHGVFSTLSCDEAFPQQGDAVRTLSLWGEDFAGIVPGCVLSAGISFADDALSSGNVQWKDAVVECPDSKKVLQYPFLSESDTN